MIQVSEIRSSVRVAARDNETGLELVRSRVHVRYIRIEFADPSDTSGISCANA
jgi:hypothetical protein